LDISKAELLQALAPQDDSSNWANSLFCKRVCDDIHTTRGIELFGCLIGDFYFDSNEIWALEKLAHIAATAAAPFITSLNPRFFNLASWADFRSWDPDFEAKLAWNNLRDSECARFLLLTIPRLLARVPHLRDTLGDLRVRFEERADLGQVDAFVWMNSV